MPARTVSGQRKSPRRGAPWLQLKRETHVGKDGKERKTSFFLETADGRSSAVAIEASTRAMAVAAVLCLALGILGTLYPVLPLH
jgi:hypothetical protein